MWSRFFEIAKYVYVWQTGQNNNNNSDGSDQTKNNKSDQTENNKKETSDQTVNNKNEILDQAENNKKETKDNLIKVENLSPFESLPEEILVDIGGYLSTHDRCKVGKTSNRLLSIFWNSVEEKEKLLKKLLLHVVLAEKDEVEEMLKVYPRLLLEKGTVTDSSGRMICGTALQLALGAEDVSIVLHRINYSVVNTPEEEIVEKIYFQQGAITSEAIKEMATFMLEHEEMAEMIARYLVQFGGKDEIVKQINEQFPKGWKEKNLQKEIADRAALKEVTKAISKSKNDEECESVLQKFKTSLKPDGIIKSGTHFNYELLAEAFLNYRANFDKFGGIGSRKNKLFLHHVINYIKRFLPANYKMAIVNGLDLVMEHRGKLKRKFVKEGGNVDDSLVQFVDNDPENDFMNLGYGKNRMLQTYALGGLAWLAKVACTKFNSNDNQKSNSNRN